MHRLRSDGPAYDNEADEDSRPRKQRKQRPCYSCAECRRLKMKCDRQVPCSNCVRRHRVEFCIPATGNTKPPRRNSSGPPEHQKDGEQAQIEHNQNVSPSHQEDPDHQPMHQGHQDEQPSHLENVQAINSIQQSADDPHHISIQENSGNHNNFNPLNLLAHALDPYAVQGHSPSNSNPAPIGNTGESLYNVPNLSRGSINATRQSIDNDQQSGSYGTLMLSQRGRSKYLGPTAGSEWLKESEMQDAPDSPLMTRAPSPELRQDTVPPQPSIITSYSTPISFPFNASPAQISTRDLLSCLPPREEAWTLVESYYRYCAWHHDVAPKASFEKTFDRVYRRAEGDSSSLINPQEIALVYIIMAQGTTFNIEMPNYDSSAEDWLHLSERALVKGDFLSNNMVAGLQTLHLMAHLHLILDKGRRGDTAWPLWGLIMRLIQAMGMHRDGDRWNLPQDVTEERRKVFWECHCADIFQAHCFSRPILNMSMKIRKPPYSDVTDLDLRLREFEQNVPFSLRCRAALIATPSRYAQLEAAIEASPEPSRRSLAISFQQTNLALNISETIINLHRPYYAKTLYDVDNVDNIESVYKHSFYTIIERCAIIIGIVADIHNRFPAVSTRQWNFWFHVFNSALCLGTLVLRDPGNALASFVIAQIDAAISLFTSLLQHGARTPRYKSNLQWLLKLRTRALSKITEATIDSGRQSTSGNREGHKENDEEDVELLGWRTRLIERMDQGRQKTIRTIHLAATPTDTQITDITDSPLNGNHFQNHLGTLDMAIPNTALPEVAPDPTNDILRDFWDPMLLQDVFAAPHDHPNPFMVNRSTWWDETPEVTQARVG
ncbi:hypothetical protein F4806DRAFT_302651 [Annulohypoxylon nitens]|nr:hypothetical protein F4806DRAFT_302651 [Annulohypoxylon nitens]